MKKIFLQTMVSMATICYPFISNAQTGVTKLGLNALVNNTTDGIYNTALGYSALNSNTTGNKNTASGANTLRFNTTGYNNTAIGYAALYHNLTGNNNSGMSAYTLFTNTTGYENTANGEESLYFNTTGAGNTANGYRSLYTNTTASGNTATGHTSLFYNTTGYSNTANGYVSLKGNTTGYLNTASGNSSLISNTTGYENTATGSFALRSNTTGYANTCTGNQSLNFNRTGYGNTANGYVSMYYNTTGLYNTANGNQALYRNNTGNYNTAVGYQALSQNVTGSNNTALGFRSDVSMDGLNNATAIGHQAVVDASNKVRIGNVLVTSIGGQVGWTTYSDGRFKKDIKENVPGLTFINSLRPITYMVNVKGLNEFYNKKLGLVADDDPVNDNANGSKVKMQQFEDAAAKIMYNGFVAQEVESAAKKLNFEFSGVDKPENKDGLYGLRYDNFIAPLVKAVQELSSKNDEKDKLISDLQSQINDLKLLITNGDNGISISSSSGYLKQNAPNPFKNNTIIRYSIPDNAGHAQIKITDTRGSVIRTFNALKGAGEVNIASGELAAGNYNYTLYVNNKIVETRQMMLLK